MTNPDEDTLDIKLRKSIADSLFAPEQPTFEVRLGAATHIGKVRSRNEDHYVVFRRRGSCEILLSNLNQDALEFHEPEVHGLVVADGMGGEAFGDFASELALKTMLRLNGHASTWMMRFTDLEGQEVQQRVEAYLKQIQKAFHQQIDQDPRLKKMGTTWTSAHLFPPHVLLVHIGDSRAYLFRNNQISQITRDQTLAQDMVDVGMDPEDVRRFRHVLTNSLGGNTRQVEAEVLHYELRAGDRLLLCSDGLSDMVDDTAMAKILRHTEAPPQSVCDQLVDAALQQGGKDNITVVVCDLHLQQG